MYLILSFAKLSVYIVAGSEDELPSLVVVVVLDTPYCKLADIKLFPIDAEEVAFLANLVVL